MNVNALPWQERHSLGFRGMGLVTTGITVMIACHNRKPRFTRSGGLGEDVAGQLVGFIPAQVRHRD